MMKLRLFFIATCFLVVTSCSFIRRQLTSAKPPELPPVQVMGIAKAQGDENPVVKTEGGFVSSSIPGVPTSENKFEYKIYKGASN